MICKKSAILFIATLGMAFTSCNSDSEYITIDDPSTQSVEVTSFSLSKNNSIVANLDSLFFSIDLATAKIFNADSLPVGTEVTKVVLNIETATVSKSEVLFKTTSGTDTVIDYSTHPNDSIDFSNGPVSLRLVSYDEKVIRSYAIEINVHKVKPDSLYWSNTDFGKIPSDFTSPSNQKTIIYNDKFYCLTSYNGSWSLGVCDNPGDNQWDVSEVNLPSDASIVSFTSTDDALYILASGLLYKSDDEGQTWESTETPMSYIYGGYGTSVLGVRDNNGTYMHVTYPATTETEVNVDCPISGTSTPLLFTSQWSTNPMFMVIGGKTASGNLSGSVWAYDGSNWSAISLSPIPGCEGALFFPYYTLSIDTQWQTNIENVLIAFGGKNQDGTISKTVYLSKDRGIHWSEAPEYMQSDLIIPRYNGQAYVADMTLSIASSRAVAPIVDWACPYIYVFGGFDSSNRLGGIRRGVLNYFTFVPIY